MEGRAFHRANGVAWRHRRLHCKGYRMLADFKEFIAKGNVMELAVAVIIAGAFATIVSSLTDDLVMPLVGYIFGGADFSNYFILLSTPDGYAGDPSDYAALKASERREEGADRARASAGNSRRT